MRSVPSSTLAFTPMCLRCTGICITRPKSSEIERIRIAHQWLNNILNLEDEKKPASRRAQDLSTKPHSRGVAAKQLAYHLADPSLLCIRQDARFDLYREAVHVLGNAARVIISRKKLLN